MNYSLYDELRNSTFSWDKDKEATFHDLKRLGIDHLLVEVPSSFLGTVSDIKSRLEIQEAYFYGSLLGTLALGKIAEGEYATTFVATLAAMGCAVIGACHHYAMSDEQITRRIDLSKCLSEH